MKNIFNSTEKRAVKHVVFLAGLYGVFVAGIMELSKSNQNGIYFSIAFIIISTILLVWKQEAIFGHILLNLLPSTKAHESLQDGTWQIVISFRESDSVEKKSIRSGTLQFKNSFIGMKVIGDKLLDHETSEIERTGWFSEDAEIIDYNDKQVLKYIYKIYGKSNNNTVQKVGVVVATKEAEDERFTGIFNDISLEENQISRSGTVVLFPADAA